VFSPFGTNKKGGDPMAIFEASDKCKVFYEITGKGEPLFLVHGWTGNHNIFKENIPYFVDNSYCVVTMDLRGHGESDSGEVLETGNTFERAAADIKELCEYLNLKNVNLAGWSMGGQIVMAYLQEFGCENLRTLTIIDMVPKYFSDDEWKLGSCYIPDIPKEVYILQMLKSIAFEWPEFVASFVPSVFPKENPNSERLKWTSDETMKNKAHCMIYGFLCMCMSDYREAMKKATIPVLLIEAERGCNPPELADWMDKTVPGKFTHACIPDAGHAMFIEQRDLFNKTYHDWLLKA